jgi:hypothetical protein
MHSRDVSAIRELQRAELGEAAQLLGRGMRDNPAKRLEWLMPSVAGMHSHGSSYQYCAVSIGEARSWALSVTAPSWECAAWRGRGCASLAYEKNWP